MPHPRNVRAEDSGRIVRGFKIQKLLAAGLSASAQYRFGQEIKLCLQRSDVERARLTKVNTI